MRLENRLLPKEKRKEVSALVAFFSLPRNISDPRELQLLKKLWNDACKNVRGWEYRTSQHVSWVPVLKSTAEIFSRYGVPCEYACEYIDAFLENSSKKSYKTYGELEKFLYGSTSIIAMTFAHVLGFEEKRALIFAEEFGYALGLTEILRTIKDDAAREKVYLPGDELASFGITLDQLRRGERSEMFTRFMGFQLSRARALYVSADDGIGLLDRNSQLFVRVLSAFHESVLDKIEERGYDVFQAPIRLSRLERFSLAFRVWRTSGNERNLPSV